MPGVALRLPVPGTMAKAANRLGLAQCMCYQMTMMNTGTASSMHMHLRSLLDEATQGLAGVTSRRMFGCDALFCCDTIFALIWKAGRIGLKIPEPSLYQTLSALPGTEPWAPGDMKPMAHWLLVPESFHDSPELLAEWVRHAHRLAAAVPAKVAKQISSKSRRT